MWNQARCTGMDYERCLGTWKRTVEVDAWHAEKLILLPHLPLSDEALLLLRLRLSEHVPEEKECNNNDREYTGEGGNEITRQRHPRVQLQGSKADQRSLVQ